MVAGGRNSPAARRLLQLFEKLSGHYGPRHWWPAETAFEVVIGAFLTQNTAWSNVEQALAALKRERMLEPEKLGSLPRTRLEELIRPAGFFRQKAERLQGFCAHLATHHAGSLERMLGGELAAVRRELLALRGIGPETADSILLYAGGRPSFVVDAYTRRLLARHGLLAGIEDYETIRAYFMRHLPVEAALYNEYHALIVEHCKVRCRKTRPTCVGCPVAGTCRFPRPATPRP